VDAAYEGDRDLALQALMLDPMVTDFDNAKQMLDEMLKLQKEQLPRFWG
jgi:alpha-galactosidase